MKKIGVEKIEEHIYSGYQKVLKHDVSNTDSDFFLQGGNSIKAMELANYLNGKYDYGITIDAIFKNSSINKLTLYITQQMSEKNSNIEELSIIKKVSQQLGIYLLSQQDLGGISYNMPVCFEVMGKIDCLKLRKAYQKIQERFDIFRTIFYLEDNELKEKVFKEPIIDFRVLDMKDISLEGEFNEFVSSFSLDVLPLTRMRVGVKNDKSYVFIDFHHIITDGISLEIFLGLLSEYYNSENFGNYVSVPRKNVHIIQNLDRQKKYWNNILGSLEYESEIIGDYSRKARREFSGNTIFSTMPSDLCLKVKKLGEECGCTEFMVYLSIYMILLSIYTMKREIIVGIPVSGRTSSESENALGMFVNTLGIKGDINENEPYIDFLTNVRKLMLDAYLNQDYPFYQLISDLGLSGRVSDNPLFNTFFIYQNYEHKVYKLDDIEMKEVRGLDKVSKFDITLEIYPDNKKTLLCLEYSTELYKESTAQVILTHYIELLKNIVDNPNILISNARCITKNEERLIKEKFNQPMRYKYPVLHFADLFEELVTRIPDAIAIVFKSKKISYRELNMRGNAVASLLRKKMQRDNCIIPFISSRGIEMIIGIVGIIKADYAFMNIDYTLPTERIKYMLAECGTKSALIGKVNSDITKLLNELNIDLIELEEAGYIEENIEITRKSDSLSYIMYTSGTTGKPKGVMIENNGLVAYSQYIGERYHFTTNTTVLQSTTYTFDPFIVETMPALLFGSKIVVTDESMMLDSTKLILYMKEQLVNIADFCPTVLARIADYLGQVKSLSIIMSGGETLPNDLKDKVLRFGIHLFNHYGPTEITVDATIQECLLQKNVTLGSPIPNKKVLLVNNNNLAGIGVPGEICISGIGVAKGYLNQEQLTSDVFIQDAEGNRWYKTGDIGKWDENGEIIYLGRSDKQIKILGHRIEISEIEECIRVIEFIDDVVVVNNCDHLIAYYVTKKEVNELKLQDKLRKSLPFYMLPNSWKKIDSIPYTINGKVDVKNLPDISEDFVMDEKPLTELESQILDFVTDILRGRKINKFDNFFRQGGNSLKAAVLLNRIKGEMHYSISLKDFFENPTVEGICNIISSVPQKNHLQDTFETNIENIDDLLATPQQKRLFIIQYNNPNYIGYNMTRCFLFKQCIDINRMKRILTEIIDKNNILRANFILRENEIYQIVHANINFDIEFIQLKNINIDDVISAFIRPFDLTKDQLLRIKVIRVKSEDYFLLDIHHIISDGISIEMLLSDIIRAYNGDKSICTRKQYTDYSIWLGKKNCSEEEVFWKSKLSGVNERTEICSDFIKKTKSYYNGKSICQYLSYELTQEIKEFCIINKCSEYAYFMSAFIILINRYCLNKKILIASPFSGRIEQKYDNALGFFVNTLLVCESVSENENFLDLLHRIMSNILGMQDNQNYSYDKMCSFLSLEEGQTIDSITDFLFVMQNMDGLSELPDFIQEVEVLVNTEIDFKIVVEIQDENNCYKINFTYASELYDETNMKYFVLHYLNILQNILLHYNTKIKYIDEQNRQESNLVTLKGNRIALKYTSVKVIFEKFASKYDEYLAVFDDNNSLTYSELNIKANKLAAFLLEKGLRKGDRLIIYAEKGIEAIIAIIACFKTGIVYIPIDKEWPMMRINFIIDSVKVKFLLSIGETSKVVNSFITILDYPYSGLESYNDNNPHIDIYTYDPAYIIFTSGTSGNPKGVQVRQEGIINLWQQNQIVKGITNNDKILQFSSLSFDALISELTMSLLSGASLAIIREKYRRDLTFLHNFIKQNKITIGVFPPHVISAVPIESLRCIITAGEEIDDVDYRKIVKSGCDYWNEYGPTEGTVCSTMWKSNERRIGYRVPIGTPICNVDISIIKEGKILGLGMLGEICIEGKNVADGYLEGDKIGTYFYNGKDRIYFTGDIGRILPNGEIEFLGRKDNQVKINGFRIELGEIENVLKMDENINEAVAYLNHNMGKKEISLAFTSKEDVDLRKLKYGLAKRLPVYMIPTHVNRVNCIPLTLSGKVDIEKLKELSNSIDNYVENIETAESTEILKLIKDILHRDDISGKDNFFSAGGTSIEAAFLINKIKQVMGKKISYYDFVICEDIFELSNLISKTDSNEDEQINSEKDLMSNAEKQIYLAAMATEKCIYNMPHSYRITKDIDIKKLKKAFVRIITENDNLHTAFYDKDGKFYKKVLDDYVVDFKYLETETKLINKEIKKFVYPFDLQNNTLIRMVVIREPESYLLFIDAHHIVFDKSSWDNFFALLQEYYHH